MRILWAFWATASLAATAPWESASLTDLAGKTVAFTSAAPAENTVVVVAVASHCPVVRKYLPVLNRMARRWEKDGVRFLLLDPASYDSPAVLKKELSEYANRIPAYLDPSRKAARALGLDVTSKVVVLVKGSPAYSGAIDDHYTLDGARAEAHASYLENVLAALRERRPVPDAGKNAVAGCAISLD